MFGISKEEFENDVLKVLQYIEKAEWNHVVNFEYLKRFPNLLTREGLRQLDQGKGVYVTKTSGSTGEPVSVQKSYMDFVWYNAIAIREFRWRKWDVRKDFAIVKTGAVEKVKEDWGIPKIIEPLQGKVYNFNNTNVSLIQNWLEKVNPTYLHAMPSVLKELDLSKISNLKDVKSTGEVGGTSYSTEECGIIALQCPDNAEVLHVSENIILETDKQNNVIITSLTNNFIKRYLHGDYVELTTCNCGRKLQSIKKIKGRIRNMFVLKNGDKKWPMIGSKEFDKFGIKKYQAVQTAFDKIELHLIDKVNNENDLKEIVKHWIDEPVNVEIKYVENFKNKFEEFVSLIQ